MATAQIQTTILEPLFHDDRTRTEFRIPTMGKVVFPNLRMVEFGFSSITQNASGNPYSFVRTGLYSLIKQITLYSGGLELQCIRDADIWLGFANMWNPTSIMYEVNSPLLGSKLGLTQMPVATINTDGTVNPSAPAALIDFESTTARQVGRINLDLVFSVLNSLNFLVDYDDLRLVIEYHTTADRMFAGAANTMPTWSISRPKIIYDVIVDDTISSKMMRTYKGDDVVFETQESEKISVPANASLTRLRAFDDKILRQIMFQVNTDGADAASKLGYCWSSAQPNERYNFVLNGAKVLPFNGCDSDGRAVAMMADSVPAMATFTLSNVNPPAALNAGINQAIYSADAIGCQNKLAFHTCDVLNRVNRLDFEYSSGAANNKVRFFGLVQKFLKKSKTGELMVGYV